VQYLVLNGVLERVIKRRDLVRSSSGKHILVRGAFDFYGEIFYPFLFTAETSEPVIGTRMRGREDTDVIPVAERKYVGVIPIIVHEVYLVIERNVRERNVFQIDSEVNLRQKELPNVVHLLLPRRPALEVVGNDE
jgi:hypothetical protein